MGITIAVGDRERERERERESDKKLANFERLVYQSIEIKKYLP